MIMQVNQTILFAVVKTATSKLNETNCSFMRDSGASVNLVDSKTHHLLGLKSTYTKLFAYGGKKPLPLLGNFKQK